ncbi:hypothetical protein JOB18_048796 [Solea senegalensis]|uniref:Uncharacterized protein n=1 Tax=Solea senegalensis TaxID=28829 RepID=A0AAV6SIB0_SOLSE|nr:hypothetical protein JOB18_048796 [Solea senegalensis]
MTAIPSLANKLGHTLVKASKLLKAQGLIMDNAELVKNATEFQEVHNHRLDEMISSTALRNINEAKWNVPTLMPFTEDVQKLHMFLNQKQDECIRELSDSPSTKTWIDLAKVCLAQIILFNRHKQGEVASMPLSAFLSRDKSAPHQDLDWALSEVEKRLCRHFTRIVIRGKRGRPVPILVTQKMLNALELLVLERKACRVLEENGYMFARPAAKTHFRGSDCLRAFSGACGATCPKTQRWTSWPTFLENTAACQDTVLCHDETDDTDETREGHYSSQESLAEETLPPTEENDIPPLHKRHKLSSAEDDSVGAVTPVEGSRNKVPSTSKRSKPPSGKDDRLRAVTSVKEQRRRRRRRRSSQKTPQSEAETSP